MKERGYYQKKKNIMVKTGMCICDGASLMQVVKGKHDMKNVQVGKTKGCVEYGSKRCFNIFTLY